MIDPAALGRVALLGTASGAVADVPLTDTPADAVVARRTGDPIERRILLAAGARAWLRRAGTVTPDTPLELPDPAPDELLEACSPSVMARIDGFFQRARAPLLPEALQMLADRDLRLPHLALPAALTRCPRDHRAAMAAVGGRRAVWLAEQNRAWRWVLEHAGGATGGPAADVEALRRAFDEGRLDDRVLALCRLREADPGAGRALLEGAWSDENAGARGLLLSALSVGLGPDDEPFIAAACADPVARVREEACALLEKLPGSALNRRHEVRAAQVLVIEEEPAASPPRGLLARLRKPAPPTAVRRLRIELPAELPDDWAADGIRDAIKPGIGKRVSWACRVLERVAPTAWAGDAPPAEVLALFSPDDWPLIGAISDSAVEVGDAGWAAALWDHWVAAPTEDAMAEVRGQEAMAKLATCLPSELLEARARPLLERGVQSAHTHWRYLLDAWPGPWPPDVARLWLDGVRARIEHSAEDDGSLAKWQGSLAVAALKLPLDLLDGRVPRLPDPTSTSFAARRWARPIETFNDLLSARIGLQRDLDGLPPVALDPLAPPGDTP